MCGSFVERAVFALLRPLPGSAVEHGARQARRRRSQRFSISLRNSPPRCPRRAAWDLPGSQAETSVSRFSGSHAHPAAHQTVRGTSGDRIPGIRAFGYPLGAKCLSRRSIPQNTFQKKVLREKRSKDYAKLPLPRKESHAVSAIPCECAQKKSPRCKNDRPDRDGHFCRMENASL